MAKKNQAEKFDEVGLKDVMKRLESHRNKLVEFVHNTSLTPRPVSGDADDDAIVQAAVAAKTDLLKACNTRDAAQYLAMTCLTIGFIGDTLIPLARMSGESQSVPYLKDCGLDWMPAELLQRLCPCSPVGKN